MNDWKIYRTRLLVKARRLTETCTLNDPLGRVQVGSPGDFLVENCDGSRRVTPAHIFHDIYVEMEPTELPLALVDNRPAKRPRTV